MLVLKMALPFIFQMWTNASINLVIQTQCVIILLDPSHVRVTQDLQEMDLHVEVLSAVNNVDFIIVIAINASYHSV